jgi:hypothetical protein
MRHWLWLTIALAGALAPTTVLAQDDEKGASDQSESASKKGSKGADKKGAQSDGGGATDEDAKPKADEGASAEESSMSDSETAELRAFDAGGGEIKPKPKAKPKAKAKPAPKDEEVGGINPSVGVLVGWGFQPWYHLAAGLRGGVDIGDIYAGATVVYAFGQTLEDKSRVAGFTFKDSGNFVLFGGEVGYNIRMDAFSARPFLGVGATVTPREWCDPKCRSETGTHVYLAPGVMGVYPIDPVFVGLDVRYNVVLGLNDGSGAMLSAIAGLQF